jgi:type I restriction enzyme S subunit
MTPGEFLSNFGVMAEAQGGVEQLRELILELAMHGRLTSPTPDDVPISTFPLGAYASGKEFLQLTEGESVEVPYPIPSGWSWTRLGALGNFSGGGTPSKSNPSFWEGAIPWVSPKDMKRPYIEDAQDHISDVALAQSATKKVPIGSLLFVVRGMILAHSLPVALALREVAINQDIKALTLAEPKMGEYLLRVYQASRKRLLKKVERSAHGTCRLESRELEQLLIPLPPLAEQKRIVAKVDQLMALCDELEARQTKKRGIGTRLTQSALDALTSAEGPEEFAKAWKRVADNFEQLFDRRERISELRRATLGLALHGRLVHQDHAEEGVAKLLERIAQSSLRARSQQSKGVHEPRAKDENRHPIPQAWKWVSVGSIASCVLGKMLDKSKHTKGRLLPYLRNINVRWGGFELSDLLSMYFEDDELERYGVRAGDVLICEGGEPGRAAVWRDTSRTMFIQKAIHRVRLEGGILPEWLVMNLRYDAWTGRLAHHFTGATIKHFTGQALARYQIRLAPIAEQKRIIAKVDQLMALCDALESKLRDAEQGAQRLSEAMASEMVA